jgi:hypothetical protein
MSRLSSFGLSALLVSFVALIASCGGGGGGGDPALLTPQASVDRAAAAALFDVDLADWGGAGGDGGDGGVGGAAGDGAPIKRAVIVVTDANGKSAQGFTNDKGNFVLTFSSFQRPLVGKVIDTGGNVLASVTSEGIDTGKFVRLNINPLTDKIVSDVLGTTTVVISTPSGTTTLVTPVGGTDKSFTGASINAAGIDGAKANMVASVSAALKAAGVAEDSLKVFDPVRSAYKHDGTGVDAVIESISHARNPVTGASELSAKIAPLTTNPDGTVVRTLITAANPLPATQLIQNADQTLTFSKLNAWVAGINRCLALPIGTADAICDDFENNVFISPTYKNNSRDFQEDFRTLLSEQNGDGVSGSTIRNPLVLFTSHYSGSTIDDLALVEVTIRQPRTGPLAGNINTPLEYTKTIVFKRDDAFTKAVAGNWVAHGNQRSYNFTAGTRYLKSTQVNPARQSNVATGLPSSYQTRLQMSFSEFVFDSQTRTYVDNNVRAVRVTGPGLPTAGLVLARPSVIGSTSLGILNKTGTIPTVATTTSTSSNSFGLAAVAVDGSTLVGTGAFNPASSNNAASPPDFSTLQAFSRYKFEIFLNSNLTTTPDVVETSVNIAPANPPASMLALPYNDISPSIPLNTAPAPSTTSILVQWVNNLSAAPVTSAQVFAQERNPKGATTGFTTVTLDFSRDVFAAYSLDNRPTSQLVTSTNPAFPSLASPAQPGDFRQIAIWSYQSRANIQNLLRWDN